MVWTCTATIRCMSSSVSGIKRVTEMLNKGLESARLLRRASILRQLDQGQRAAQVADNVGVVPKTSRRCLALRGGGTGTGVV